MKKEHIYSLSILALILLYGFMAFPDYKPAPQLTTTITAYILGLLGHPVLIHNNYLVGFNQNSYIISAECSGIIFILAIIATIQLVPLLNIKQKIISLALIPLLLLGNIIRIITGFLIELNHGITGHLFFHNTFGQLFIFFWTITLYIVILKIFKLMPTEKKRHLAHRRNFKT